MARDSSLKTIDSLSALSPGCDLWIVADAAQSAWSRKIDWYLNFQLRRASMHKTPQISSEMKKVIEQCEAELPNQDIEVGGRAPLMVASFQLLPNKTTVQIAHSDDPSAWVQACHKVWVDMGRPLMRIFLPDKMSPEAFERVWPVRDGGTTAVEVVS